MSECNYCTLKGIKARYKGTETKVYVVGNTVYTVPEGKQLDTSPNSKQFAAWLMDIPPYCCC